MQATPSPKIQRIGQPAGSPMLDQPRLDRRLQGAPQRQTWTEYEALHEGLSCGVWTCEPGSWRIVFAPRKHEYFYVIEGRLRLHDSSGAITEVCAGQAAVIPAGFEGVFEVLEPVRKHFVVVEPPATGG
ncbi:cupin domain-containing protein [Paucibacter sp. APW11]|uniref:Cupin domain-containing protein n=1 Tax=Roseateles aquae TaxID=3077235 RepID=A0ABU3PDZ9_9BURK|nr:cupin domain-containing protein [Paucibacter sp. APW11]MDT9000352.1 cupin domain-containing protein [Paucibacter sp. APW11]